MYRFQICLQIRNQWSRKPYNNHFQADLTSFRILIEDIVRSFVTFADFRRHISAVILNFTNRHVLFESTQVYEYFETSNVFFHCVNFWKERWPSWRETSHKYVYISYSAYKSIVSWNCRKINNLRDILHFTLAHFDIKYKISHKLFSFS